MPKFPPDIKSKIPKLSPQELEFFKEAKKIQLKFNNLFSSAIPTSAVLSKVMSSKETTADAVRLKAQLPIIIADLTSLELVGTQFFNPKSPNNFISSMKIANMANDISAKMGDTENSSKNTQATFGEFAKYNMMAECVQHASTEYINDLSKDLSSIFTAKNDSMPSGTLASFFFALHTQVTTVKTGLDSFQDMKAQIEEFTSLNSLKALFNNPIANALMSGDISTGIPPIATPAMLSLLRLPPKF